MQNPHGQLFNTTLLSTFWGCGSNFILLLYVLRWVGGRANAPLMTKIQKVVFDPSSKIWDCLILLSTCLLPCAELHPIMGADSGIPWIICICPHKGAKSIRSSGEPTIVTGCSKYVTISRPNLEESDFQNYVSWKAQKESLVPKISSPTGHTLRVVHQL